MKFSIFASFFPVFVFVELAGTGFGRELAFLESFPIGISSRIQARLLDVVNGFERYAGVGVVAKLGSQFAC